MGRRDFFKKKIWIIIFTLFLALFFSLFFSINVEALDDRVGHIYCNFKDASPNDDASDFVINQKYIFSNQKLEQTYANTTLAPSFSIFKVDIMWFQG